VTAIIKTHASPRILYRMIASNETEFNKPDNEDDVFALAVRALHGATQKEASDLIQNILAQKPGGTRSTLINILGNDDEMNRYSNLLAFRMFKANHFISFWKLNQQKHFAQSVSHFLYVMCEMLIYILVHFTICRLGNRLPSASELIAQRVSARS
jgi:hypothetical protein